MKISANEIKVGNILEFENKLWIVLKLEHTKPGKGGAFVRTKLKDIQTGKIIDHTFNSGARLEFIRLEAKQMQFLYLDGENYVFMDNETYEQLMVHENIISENKRYLIAGMNVDIIFDNEEILDIRIPAHVILEVIKTEPGFKGNTATGASKPATVETGIELSVPLFIDEKEHIKIDTRSGEYVERAKK